MERQRRETGKISGRVLMALGLVIFMAACSTPLTTREKGALAGGAIGAGTGAVIGSATGHAGTGALIGAGVGVIGGALVGDAMQANEQRQAAPPPPPPPAVVAPMPAPVVVAPPQPSVSLGVSIGSQPSLVGVPGTPVLYAPSLPYNYFYFGGQYYLFHNEVWLSARAYNGPWVAISLEQVPRPVLVVPVNYYKVPPGHWKKKAGPPPWAPAKGHAKKHRDDD